MKYAYSCYFLLIFSCSVFSQTLQSKNELNLEQNSVHTIKLEGYPDFLVADGSNVWVTNTNKIQKLSRKKNTPVLTVEMPDPCGAPVVAGGFIYIASCKSRSVYKVNTRTGKVEAIIPVNISDPSGEISLAYGAGSLWILSDSLGILSRIDSRTNSIIATIQVKPNSYCAVFGYHSVWISNSKVNGSVQRIDPRSNKVIETISVGPLPHFLAAGAHGIWTLNQQDGSISHINPLTNKLEATIYAGLAGTGGDIATGQEKAWVRSKNGTALLSIDGRINKIKDRYFPLCGSGAVRVAGRYIWVTAHDVHTVWVLKNNG